MKIKSIKVVRIKLPDIKTTKTPGRSSWANFSKRAMPLNYYSEFSRLPQKIPGNKLDNIWVKTTAEDVPVCISFFSAVPKKAPSSVIVHHGIQY